MSKHRVYEVVVLTVEGWEIRRTKMSKQYTMAEIAEDYELWGEYVDPGANMTEEEFDALTTEEKVQMQREMFPYEAAEEDERLAKENE